MCVGLVYESPSAEQNLDERVEVFAATGRGAGAQRFVESADLRQRLHVERKVRAGSEITAGIRKQWRILAVLFHVVDARFGAVPPRNALGYHARP